MRAPNTSGRDDLCAAAHVWHLCPTDISPAALERGCLHWLSGQEHAYRQQLRTAKLQHEYLTARALCRAVLSRYIGVDPAAWEFGRRSRGKPVIACPREFKGVRFNLTHTEGLVACIVTSAAEVGVDAEDVSRAIDFAQVGRYFLTPAERAGMESLPAKRRTDYFFERWVLKEAYLKGRGTGFSQSPARFAINLNETGEPLPLGNWQLSLHRPTPRHVAATAVRIRRGGAAIPIKWFAAGGLVETGIAVEGGRIPDRRIV